MKKKIKILLYESYSNYSVNLAKGLEKLGYDVGVASLPDGFKRSDIELKRYRLYNVKGQIKLFNQLKKMFGTYDVVQFISPVCLPVFSYFYFFIMTTLFNKKYNIFSSVVGCDYVFWTTGRRCLEIPLFEEVEKYDPVKKSGKLRGKIVNFLTRRFIIGYIGMPEYCYSYKADEKYKNKPVALTLAATNIKHKYEDIDFNKFFQKEKLVFFHGIPKGREGFKGSNHILKAFDIAREKYKDIAEFITVTSLPYDEYIDIMNKTDIIFDQTNFHIYGMAALEAMEAGKIVASSSQDKNFWDKVSKDLGLDFIPKIYSLKPDSEYILSQIDKIIADKQKLPDIAKHNRKFVEKYHDPKLVAQRHLNFWQRNMVNK